MPEEVMVAEVLTIAIEPTPAPPVSDTGPMKLVALLDVIRALACVPVPPTSVMGLLPLKLAGPLVDMRAKDWVPVPPDSPIVPLVRLTPCSD